MKRSSLLAAVTLAFLMFAGTVRAQGSGMYLENWKDILIGPMAEGGMAVNAGSIQTGTKTAPLTSFAAGATMIYPWSENIGLNLTVGYDARAINFHAATADTGGVDYHYNYLMIRPEFRLAGFTIGLGIGLPMSTSATNLKSDLAPTSSDMNTLMEGRIGGEIVLSRTDANQLHLLLGASYGFNPILKTTFTGKYGLDNTKNNGPLASAMIGLSYLFDVTPH